jgi:hypothetical protein
MKGMMSKSFRPCASDQAPTNRQNITDGKATEKFINTMNVQPNLVVCPSTHHYVGTLISVSGPSELAIKLVHLS